MKESLKNTVFEDIRVSTLSDEEIDEMIRPVIKEMKEAAGNHKRVPSWNDNMKAIRRVAVLRLIRQGKSNAKIVNELQDRWGISYQNGKSYIDDALKGLQELDSEPLIKKQAIEEMLRDTMEKCMAEGRQKEAMQALDMLNKMGGNYVTKVEAEIKTEIEFNFGGTDEEDKG